MHVLVRPRLTIILFSFLFTLALCVRVCVPVCAITCDIFIRSFFVCCSFECANINNNNAMREREKKLLFNVRCCIHNRHWSGILYILVHHSSSSILPHDFKAKQRFRRWWRWLTQAAGTQTNKQINQATTTTGNLLLLAREWRVREPLKTIEVL